MTERHSEAEELSDRDVVGILYTAVYDAMLSALSEIDIEGAVLEGVRAATDEAIEAIQARFLRPSRH